MRALANLGSGFDVVSAGELQRVIAAGGDPKKCVFAGVAKSEAEIEFALRKGIYSFNCESEPEIVRINQVAARLKKRAPIAVRVNPNVAAQDARQNHDRHLRKQIRHRVRARRRRLCAREQAEKHPAARRADAHRLATDGRDALRTGGEKSSAAREKTGGEIRAGIFQPRRRAGHHLQSGAGERFGRLVEIVRRERHFDAGKLRGKTAAAAASRWA